MTAMNSRSKGRSRPICSARLDRMVAEATADCYNESEQLCGIFTMLEEKLALPFSTSVLGTKVIVEHLDLTEAEVIVAVCRRGRVRQRIPLLDLPLPDTKPPGTEWIDAYRRWCRRR